MRILCGIEKEKILLKKPNIIIYKKEVDNLDVYQKAKIFLDYHITMLYLGYHRNNIIKMDEFLSEDNIVIKDMGEDWEKHRFAQQYHDYYTGIYDWYWKFKYRINL